MMYPEPKLPTIPIVQVMLRSEHNEVMTTWVDKRPNLKEGSIIFLRDFKPDTRWLVIKLYPQTHDAKDFDWHRKWTNNI